MKVGHENGRIKFYQLIRITQMINCRARNERVIFVQEQKRETEKIVSLESSFIEKVASFFIVTKHHF